LCQAASGRGAGSSSAAMLRKMVDQDAFEAEEEVHFACCAVLSSSSFSMHVRLFACACLLALRCLLELRRSSRDRPPTPRVLPNATEAGTFTAAVVRSVLRLHRVTWAFRSSTSAAARQLCLRVMLP
jgi:hypothetical protein